MPRDVQSAQSGREIIGWESSCCGSEKMTTRGGDGSPGSPCWTACTACGETCEPLPVYFCPACTLGVGGCTCEIVAPAEPLRVDYSDGDFA